MTCLFLLAGILIGLGLVAAVVLALEWLLGGESPWSWQTYWQHNEQILLTLLALPAGVLVARYVFRHKSKDQKSQ